MVSALLSRLLAFAQPTTSSVLGPGRAASPMRKMVKRMSISSQSRPGFRGTFLLAWRFFGLGSVALAFSVGFSEEHWLSWCMANPYRHSVVFGHLAMMRSISESCSVNLWSINDWNEAPC